MEGTEKGTTIKCSFDKTLNMPQKCVSCNEPISDGLFEVAAYTTFRTSKATFKFPVCDACFHANQRYVDIVVILIISSIALLLSIFTIFNQPDYLDIPRTWYLIGGGVWLTILVGWMVVTVMRARTQNSPELVARRSNLKVSVKALKLVPPKRSQNGEITFNFKNAVFAKEFKKLNRGKVVR